MLVLHGDDDDGSSSSSSRVKPMIKAAQCELLFIYLFVESHHPRIYHSTSLGTGS